MMLILGYHRRRHSLGVGDRETRPLPPQNWELPVPSISNLHHHNRRYHNRRSRRRASDECVDDRDAIGKAAQLTNGKSVELWEGARLIARFPSDEG